MWWCWTISPPPRVTEEINEASLAVEGADGHHWQLLAAIPQRPHATVLWLPALGVAARHYRPLADALAARGVAAFVHEWRGHGSSSLRAGHGRDWGYRELLECDIPASEAAIAAHVPSLERVLGGHSLGGQLACCRVAMDTHAASRLWLVGSGSPYWRAFPLPARWMLPAAYRLLPWLARRHGALPGRRIGFGGAEALGVMTDWAHTARSGRYAGKHLVVDLEAALATVNADICAVAFTSDWLAPSSSLHYLLAKMPRARAALVTLDSATLGLRADHFAWMRQPARVVESLLDPVQG